MASEGPNDPGTAADDDSVGTVAWTNTDNAKTAGDGNAIADFYGSDSSSFIRDVNVKIVKSNGAIGTENKAATETNWPAAFTYVSYGGSSDLWGETWSDTDINDVDFGVVLSVKDTYSSAESHYLKVTNFNFSIPSGATINGITVEIEKIKDWVAAMNLLKAAVDHIRITVYYTEAAAGTNIKVNIGDGLNQFYTEYVG